MLLIFISSKPVSLQFATCRHSGAFNGQDVGKRSDSRLTVGWESFQGKAASKACARKVGQCDHNGDVLGCLHDIVMVVIVFDSKVRVCHYWAFAGILNTLSLEQETPRLLKVGFFTTLTIVSLADNHKYYSQYFLCKVLILNAAGKWWSRKLLGDYVPPLNLASLEPIYRWFLCFCCVEFTKPNYM